MNELICLAIIFAWAFAIGGLIYIGQKIFPSIRCFIKWQIFKKK